LTICILISNFKIKDQNNEKAITYYKGNASGSVFFDFVNDLIIGHIDKIEKTVLVDKPGNEPDAELSLPFQPRFL
jgi:hypothetical protein